MDCGAFYEVVFCKPSSSTAVGTFLHSLNVRVERRKQASEVTLASVRFRTLLARSPSQLRPEFWITSGMQDCKDYNALRFDTEEDSVRELGNEGAPYLAVYTRKHFWIALNRVERRN